MLGVGLGHLEQLLPSIQGLLKVTERCASEAVTLFAEQNPQVPAVRRIREQYRIPLHAASFGQVLLAYESADFIEGYLAQPLRRVSPKTMTEPSAVSDVLARIREQGYAVSRAELQSDNGSIAVPVFRKDGSVVAALSAILPLQLMEDAQVYEQQRQLLQATAVTISESLGWRAYRETAFRAGA